MKTAGTKEKTKALKIEEKPYGWEE